MSPWMIGCSIPVGHGTATRKKRIGKAKCFSQGRPPARHIKISAKPTTTIEYVQLSGRQSGFATSMSRMGKTRNNNPQARASARGEALLGGCASGRSSQRSQKRYKAKKGTNQP